MHRAAPLATLVLALGIAGCATPPGPPPAGRIADPVARYACSDGTAFTARFDQGGDAAWLTFAHVDPDDPDALAQDRDFRIRLDGQRVASGMLYAGSGWSLRGKGSDATLARPDGRTSQCRAANPDAAPPGPDAPVPDPPGTV